MRSFPKLLFILSIASCCLQGCSEGSFSGGNGKGGSANGKNKKPVQPVPPTLPPGSTGTTGGGYQPTGGGNQATGGATAGSTAGSTSCSPTTGGATTYCSGGTPDVIASGDGNLTLGKRISRVDIRMSVDHVSDFHVTATEIYIIHHELALPTIGSFILYDQNGQVIDTQQWVPTFAGCDPYPRFDSNCKSSVVQLAGGSSLTGNLTAVQGRGEVVKLAGPPDFTVRVMDCGASDCGSYGAQGAKHSGADYYSWSMQ